MRRVRPAKWRCTVSALACAIGASALRLTQPTGLAQAAVPQILLYDPEIWFGLLPFVLANVKASIETRAAGPM